MKIRLSIIMLSLVFFWIGCDEERFMPTTADDLMESFKSNEATKAMHATGDIQVTFYPMGGQNHGGQSVENGPAADVLKYAHVVFDAHEAAKKNPAKGMVSIHMTDENGEITRQFTADVTGVLVEPELMRARFLAIVVSDIKTESDDSDHGHDDGGHDEGGHDEGDHEEGDHEEGEHGNSGTPKGNQSRVGQILAVTVIDGGTPGNNGDEIGWKWFGVNNPNQPVLENPAGWGSLENRNIVAGNLTVHVK